MMSRDVTAQNGSVSLAGTLWLPPEGRPALTVLMHPGSGPSDRDNDVYFPPIREHLLSAGFAVCSFDKRGVGGSTGRWQETGILEQADDALAALDVLLSYPELGCPVGLFGHSQGGWVVIEAAGRGAPVAFVVSNSGPGVTPAEQERFAMRTYLEEAGVSAAHIEEAMPYFDRLLEMMRERIPLAEVRRRMKDDDFPAAYENVELPLLPDDAELWELAALLLDYDPRPALERIEVPLLALFGRDDRIVPVEESVAVYREAVYPELLTVALFEGGNHRIQTGDPPVLAGGYRETLASFVAAAV